MKILFYALVFSGLSLPLVAVSSVDAEPRCVILLHDLARTDASMLVMEHALQAAGYTLVNHGYPSRETPEALLADPALRAERAGCGA